MSKLNMPVANYATGSYYQNSLDLTLTTDSYPVKTATITNVLSKMQTARSGHSSFVIDGKAYVAGGNNKRRVGISNSLHFR